MLRVLFIILAVVSFSLAIVLGRPLLYLLAFVLLVGALVLLTVNMRRRHRDVPEKFMQAPMHPEEDLSSLGILEIKPIETENQNSDLETIGSIEGEKQQEVSVDSEGPSAGLHTVAIEVPSDSMEVLATGKARTRAPRPRIMVSEASTPSYEDVLIPCLSSLQASVDAYTVCLLRQEDTPLRYHVEVMISQNSYARSGGSYSAKEPILSGHRALVPVVYPRVGPNGFPKAKLRYYHEPINIRQVAMVPVVPKKHDDLFVLVLDTMNDDGLEAASVRVLMEQYARLITTILDTEAEGGLADLDASTTPKPRREIIADEMERARAMAHPLSLALVFLNQGEELAGDGSTDVDSLENEFSERLKNVAVDARVERFGELTYGIFYHGSKEGVARWASGIQDAFPDEDESLSGGVSVGVAVMQERHSGAEELKSDASAALLEAFQSGECIIVE